MNDNESDLCENQRERLINELKKENFGLKMRIYYLQQNLDKLTPEGMKELVQEHVELKMLVDKGIGNAPVDEIRIENKKLKEKLKAKNPLRKSDAILITRTLKLATQRIKKIQEFIEID